MSGWGKYQTAEEMEVGRKYEYDPEFLPVLHKWLSLKPGTVVADVGCGSGYFTRILARGLEGEGKVVGIDPDETLILEAEKIAKGKKLPNTEFKVGSIYKIPLPDNYADLVACHMVLSNIPRQFDAVLEMKRIAKIDGRVAIIDHATLKPFIYYPDKKLNKLHEKFRKAFGTALDKEWRQKLDIPNYIENIHLKLPELFLKAGLTNITLNGYLSTFLLCDLRHEIEEMQKYLRVRLDLWRKLKNRNKECARIGGMSAEEFKEFFQRYADYLDDMIRNPNKIRQTAEVEIVSRVIVCGNKEQ